MSQITIEISFDEEKLNALDFSLQKENTSAQMRLSRRWRSCMKRRCRMPCGNMWTASPPLRQSVPQSSRARSLRLQRKRRRQFLCR